MRNELSKTGSMRQYGKMASVRCLMAIKIRGISLENEALK